MIKLAVKQAAKSKHKQHRFGAVLLRGGKPIVVSHNFAYVHAEHAVLNRAWKNEISGATLVVVRVTKNGRLGMALPCNVCIRRMYAAGVKKVLYSSEDGSIKEIKLSSLKLDMSKPMEYPYMSAYVDSKAVNFRYSWVEELQ